MVDLASTDALSAALALTRLRGSVFGLGVLRAPWGVRSQGLEHPICFVIAEGHAHLTVRAGFSLHKGDAVVVRPGTPFTLRDTPTSRALPLDQMLREAARRRRQGSGPRTKVVCGSLELDSAGTALFAQALPPAILLLHKSARPTTQAVVAALVAEVAEPGLASAPIRTRLAELVFLEAMRAAPPAKGASGWLRALNDPALAKALAAIHRAPGRSWTVESLAAVAMMSRSSFAVAFHRLVGETPLAYVTSWRMLQAARLLEEGSIELKSIAAAVGYGSDEAFSRAFRVWSGEPPGLYRRRHQAAEPLDVGNR